MATTIHRVHASGNGGSSKRPAATGPETVAAYAETYAKVADVISATETTTAQWRALVNAMPDWKVWIPGPLAEMPHPEGSLMWRVDTWRNVAAYAVKLSDDRFFTAKGHQQPPVAAYAAVLRRVNNPSLLYIPIVVHMPSHVENPAGDPVLGGPVRRVRAYWSCLKSLRLLLHTLRADYPGALIDLCWDTNLDHKRAPVRAFMRTLMGGRLTWATQVHAHHSWAWLRVWSRLPGTHGDRLIDVSRLYGARHRAGVLAIHVLDAQPGFDHRAFWQKIRVA